MKNKFNVGDFLIYKDTDYMDKAVIRGVVEVKDDDYRLARMEPGMEDYTYFLGIAVTETVYSLHYRYVKATNLAKRLYPDHEIESGYIKVKFE